MNSFRVWAVVSASFFSCGNFGDHDKSGNEIDDVPASAPESALKQAPNNAAANAAALAVTPRNFVPVDGLPIIGDANAPVTIVELTDYDCPYCAKAEQTMQTLRTTYGKDLRFAVAETPLPMHDHSSAVALFALAANEHGAFQAAHEALFANRTAHSDADLQKLAGTLGIAWSAPSSAASRGLQTSEALANALHVHGTPTFYVNGRKISGAQPLATFTTIIDEERAHASALIASGVSRSRVYDRILEEASLHPAPLDDASEPTTFAPDAVSLNGTLVMGAPNAKQTIVLFTDFECPYCKKLDAELRALTTEEKDVRVVMRNRPLPIHANARLAAKAAIAAESQGKAAAYTQALFQHQGASRPAGENALDRASLVAYAGDVGLDVVRFERDIDSPENEARLLEDLALAQKLDVRGTPTSFIAGNRIIGAQPPQTFDAELTKSRAH